MGIFVTFLSCASGSFPQEWSLDPPRKAETALTTLPSASATGLCTAQAAEWLTTTPAASLQWGPPCDPPDLPGAADTGPQLGT